MAGGALAATVAGGWWFTLLVATASVLMCWEWGRLVRGAQAGVDLGLGLHVAAVLVAVLLASFGFPGRGALVLAVAAAGLLVLDMSRPMSALGVAYVGLPVLLIVWLRSDAALGLTGVLYLFAAVWITDIAAYAAGRTFGGPKLAPSISPGKTWSGLIGGVTCAGLAGAAFAPFVEGASAGRLGLLAVVLAVAAQGGDLYESALKRRSGLKDASGLIPGHGGILDRVDGLVAAVAAAAVIVLLPHASAPARGLLLGL